MWLLNNVDDNKSFLFRRVWKFGNNHFNIDLEGKVGTNGRKNTPDGFSDHNDSYRFEQPSCPFGFILSVNLFLSLFLLNTYSLYLQTILASRIQ